MKTAINYWTIGGFDNAKPVTQAMDEARAMGYQGIELTYGAGQLGPDTPDSELAAIRRHARKTGLGLPSLAAGSYWGCSLSSEDAGERRRAMAFTRKYLHAASVLGVPAVLVIPGYVHVGWDPKSPVVPYQTAWDLARRSIRALVPHAARAGVVMAIENVWNKFLLSPREMREFIDSFRSKWVGAYLDPANTAIHGFPEHWIQILGPRIRCVHVKNFTRQDAGGTLHGFGERILAGDVDWRSVVKALRAVGYHGWLTAELIPFCRLPDLRLPDLKLARTGLRELRKLV